MVFQTLSYSLFNHLTRALARKTFQEFRSKKVTFVHGDVMQV